MNDSLPNEKEIFGNRPTSERESSRESEFAKIESDYSRRQAGGSCRKFRRIKSRWTELSADPFQRNTFNAFNAVTSAG